MKIFLNKLRGLCTPLSQTVFMLFEMSHRCQSFVCYFSVYLACKPLAFFLLFFFSQCKYVRSLSLELSIEVSFFDLELDLLGPMKNHLLSVNTFLYLVHHAYNYFSIYFVQVIDCVSYVFLSYTILFTSFNYPCIN